MTPTKTQILRNISQDIKLWFYFAGYMTLFRLTLIWLFRQKIDTTTASSDLFWTLLNGFHYDAIVASIWLLPSVLATVVGGSVQKISGDRLRLGLGDVFNVLAAIACVTTVTYFREFDDQFNRTIFEVYYENTMAVLRTIWSDYHIALSLFIIGIIITAAYAALRLILRTDAGDAAFSSKRNVTATSGLLLIFPLSLIFAFGNTHVHNPRDAFSHGSQNISDTFLQKTVHNPFTAFYDAIANYFSSGDAYGLDAFLPSGDIKQAARAYFGAEASFDSLDGYLKREAPGTHHKPRHIFLIIMESLDVWPLMKKYEELGLTENLIKYAKEGLYIRNFLPSVDYSDASREAIITGMPYVMQQFGTLSEQERALPTSLAVAFDRLGYRSRLFYGGEVHATHLARLARSQGFSEIYGAEHIPHKDSTNPWGVHDELLFNFVLQRLDDEQPSFNVIITTSFHPPYSIDLQKAGFPLKNIPASVLPYYDGTTDLRTLGHLWYSDQCIGAFVRRAEQAVHAPLFAFTGDHVSRRFLSAKPDFFESSTVPFILYGKQVLQDAHIPDTMAGSHIDIAPTLINLAAPKGFIYYAIGTDLFSASPNHIGIGFYTVIGPDFLIRIFGTSRVYPLPGKPLPAKLPEIGPLRTRVNQLYAIGWWQLHKGSDLNVH